MSGINLGSHKENFYSKSENLSVGKKIAENLTVEKAIEVADKNKGTELLVEKKSLGEEKNYDVYEVKSNKKGSVSSNIEFLSDVKFDKSVAKKLGGEKAIVSIDDDGKGKSTFWNVREKNISNDLDYLGFATKENLKSLISEGKPALPMTMPEIYMNEGIQYKASKVIKD